MASQKVNLRYIGSFFIVIIHINIEMILYRHRNIDFNYLVQP